MNTLIKSGITLVVMVVITASSSMAQFTLSGEYRPRIEYRHGFKTLANTVQDNATFIDQRSRINFDYKTTGYAFKLVLQDVRVWGSQKQLVSNDGSLTSLHEAWAEIFLKENLSLKLGRQEIIYDDHRIFGSVGWVQQARSHDAAIVKYEIADWKAHFGLAYNQDGASLSGTVYTVPGGAYKAFQNLWINKKTENFEGSLLVLNNGKQSTTVGENKIYYSQTIGTRLGYKMNDLNGHVVYYNQGGKEPDGTTKISASLIGLDVGYKVNNALIVGAGFEKQSGNSQTNPSAKNEAFNPFYGTNHKFNGFMDYFYVGNHIGSVGLQDIIINVKYAPEKFNAGVNVHFFSASNDVVNSSDGTTMSNGLGTEIDFTLGFKLAEGVTLKSGYSKMIGTDTMEALKGGDKDANSQWAWSMIVIKPQFFTTAKSDK